MRTLLAHQGLEETLRDLRSEKKPSKLSDEEMQDALDKAHSTLILSLGDAVLREVGDQTTVTGLWKKLEDLYTKKSLTKRLYTKKSATKMDISRRTVQKERTMEKMDPKIMKMLLLHQKKKDDDGYDSAGVLLATGTQSNGKSSRTSFKTTVHKTKGTLDYIHSDLWGPAQTTSLSGAKYFISLIDDYSRMVWVYLLKEGVKGYKLWCTDLKPPRCMVSRDVVFNEQEMLKSYTEKLEDSNKDTNLLKDHIKVELTGKSGDTTSYETSEDEGRDVDNFDETSESQTTLQDYQLAKDNEMRVIRAPKKYAYADRITYALTAAHELDYDEPKSYKEAVSGKNEDQWLEAMKEEMDSLNKNDTWVLVRKPDKKKVIGCKWVFKLKQGISRVEPVRFKARLVAKGFTQKKGIDFTEVFSPVVRHASIRIILSLVVVNNMHLEQMDVKTTFLYGELQEHIVMAQPEGFIDKSKVDWKFQRCNLDYCVYFREDSGKLKGEFDMKDLSPAKKILGIQLHRNRNIRTLFLIQEEYIRRVLAKFRMANSKLVQTPLAPHFRLSDQLCPKAEAEMSEKMNVPYTSAVGCLMYAMVLTRPDLSYVVSVVRRYMANPGKEHWRAVKWILRPLVGYLFTFNNCTVNWKAQLQSVVALSTIETKYIAAAKAVKESIWLKGMLKELGVDQRSMMINCDSQSAICLSKNQAHYERTKHIDIKLHFIRLEVLKATVKLQKIHKDKNVADMLTKPVTTAKFKLCLELAGICQK
ncbi:hypothetical protein KPL70_025861 [Citrus sinensis]|nr:hypothetical protein KPL70_025861 [Citrus sinensis]